MTANSNRTERSGKESQDKIADSDCHKRVNAPNQLIKGSSERRGGETQEEIC